MDGVQNSWSGCFGGRLEANQECTSEHGSSMAPSSGKVFLGVYGGHNSIELLCASRLFTFWVRRHVVFSLKITRLYGA